MKDFKRERESRVLFNGAVNCKKKKNYSVDGT